MVISLRKYTKYSFIIFTFSLKKCYICEKYIIMSHIHIALVGNETYPVYSVIQFLNPDKVFLICSDGHTGSIKEANTVSKKISLPSEQVELFPVAPADFDIIYHRIDELKNRIDTNDYLTINITGGTKFWALALYKAFVSRPDTQFYLFNQNNTLWNLETNKSTPIAGLGLDTIISLYGNDTTTFKNFRDYTEEDEKVLVELEKARSFNFKAFNQLAATPAKENAEELKSKPSGMFTDSTGNAIMWVKPDKVVLTFKKKDGQMLNSQLSSPHAVSLTFNSGWFEFKVAKLLSGWSKAKEMRLNCIFPLKGGLLKNEVDIIINTDVKPVFVECKTSVHTATDIDKFATVVSNYGGAACKAVFITDQPMKDLPATKCKESDIAAFALENKTVEDLYRFLDSILLESNK